jgi:hypothetical protein
MQNLSPINKDFTKCIKQDDEKETLPVITKLSLRPQDEQ